MTSVLEISEISNIENSPVIGTLPDFIVRLNYSVATAASDVISIDSIKQVVDKRGTWNGDMINTI